MRSGRGNLVGEWEDQSSANSSCESIAEQDDVQALAQELLEALGAAGVAIVHQQRDTAGVLICVVSVGDSVPSPGVRLDPDSGISGQCIREERVLCCYDARQDPRVEQSVSEELGIRSLVAAPLMAGSRCIGLIEAVSHRIGHFDQAKILKVERAADRATALLQAPPSPRPAEPLLVADSPACEEPAGGAHSPLASEDGSIREGGATGTPANVGRGAWLPRSHRRGTVLLLFILAVLIVGMGVRSWNRSSKQQRAGWTGAGVAGTSASSTSMPAKRNDQATTPAPAVSSHHEDPNAEMTALTQEAGRGARLAQMNLARLYLSGRGVARDEVRAAAWYIIAGENGSREAKRRSIEITRRMSKSGIGEVRLAVGQMYRNGIGAHVDDIAAYAWFELARAAGDRRAEAEESSLRSTMKNAEVQAARQRAASWLRSHSLARRARER